MLVCALCCSLPDCFCSNTSESPSCFSWKSSSSVDTELVWLSRAASCPSARTTNKHTSQKWWAVLSNRGSDLSCQLGLTFFSKDGCRRIQAEQDGQRSLVGQSESPQHCLAHHTWSEVNELAVNFKLVGKKAKNKTVCIANMYTKKTENDSGLWVIPDVFVVAWSKLKWAYSTPLTSHFFIVHRRGTAKTPVSAENTISPSRSLLNCR